MASINLQNNETFYPGTVVRILDEWNEGDRSYYVVASRVGGTDRVDIIPTVWDHPITPRQTVRIWMLRVIAHCDAKGNLEMARPQIGGSECPLAGKSGGAEG